MEPSERVWLQLEFDWLPYGFLPAVTEAHAAAFEQALVDLGFAVASVDASTKSRLVQELRRALDLPEWCGSPNWDSVLDCLSEVDWPPRQAVVLRNSDHYAAASPKDFGETCAILAGYFDRHVEHQFVLVITGSGPAFYDPSHPSSDRESDHLEYSPMAVARHAGKSTG